METLGEYLKAAREAKGLTLSEMAERTRISLSFLQALEKDDHDAIPGEVFVSGFLRSYAKELGLREKDVMARYKGAGSGARETKAETPKEPDRYAPPAPKKKVVSGRLVYALAAGVAIVVVIYLLTSPAEVPAPKPVSLPQPAVKPVMSPATTFNNYTTSFEKITPAAPAAVMPHTLGVRPIAGEAAAVAVRLNAREETWYNVSVDGSITRSGLMEPGDVLDLYANSKLTLDLGNAGGVDVQFNGKPLKPFGPSGAVRRGIYFTKDKYGVLPRPIRIHSITPAG
jgi:cytoskeleton protein RodZ